MKDLGWANDWHEVPNIVKNCKHKTESLDVGPRNRGLHNIVTCELCKYRYHYDSSD